MSNGFRLSKFWIIRGWSNRLGNCRKFTRCWSKSRSRRFLIWMRCILTRLTRMRKIWLSICWIPLVIWMWRMWRRSLWCLRRIIRRNLMWGMIRWILRFRVIRIKIEFWRLRMGNWRRLIESMKRIIMRIWIMGCLILRMRSQGSRLLRWARLLRLIWGKVRIRPEQALRLERLHR